MTNSEFVDDKKIKDILNFIKQYGANPQRGGYYKFNKQFLTPVAFPDILSSSNFIKDVIALIILKKSDISSDFLRYITSFVLLFNIFGVKLNLLINLETYSACLLSCKFISKW